ncbi:retrotransposon protein, putative, ty1-copia subclass [Tanacetum coccineum]
MLLLCYTYNVKTVTDKEFFNTVESNAVRMDNTSAPIIEDWNSDDESEIDYTIVPSIEKTKSVKTVRETDAAKQNSRGNQRNWNNLMSQRPGNDFKMTNKAVIPLQCFEHLHYVFQNEVENQIGKKIKAIQSDRGGEYLSQDFVNHMKSCGIVSQLTPPYTPQHNGVSERRNWTLLDMVRSMMNLTTLPKSFWGYALETAARILNMVPTKKVDRTPYEIWHGRPPKLSYLRETMGYYFYYPLENKIFVSRNAEFFENSFMIQEASRSHELLKMSGSDKGLKLIQEEGSQRILARPDRYGYYVDCGSKWIFKKKTDLDGNVHIFKARLVAKGYTQTYRVDYEETFSPVADIRAIRILLAIAAFYDYKIWQIDVKTAFLNGHLSEDNKRFDEEIKKIGFTQNLDEPCVYLKAGGSNFAFFVLYVDDILLMGNSIAMLQEIKSWLCKCYSIKDLGEAAYILRIKIIRNRSKRLIALSQSAYLEKILKKFRMENSKKGYTPMMKRPYYRKSQGAKTPTEVQRIRFHQNPGEIYWTTVKTILKYLRNTKDMVLVYGAKPEDELKVSCYADACFQTDKDDTKSQTGYVIVLNGGAVDWKSTKQSTTAMSYTEAEYIAVVKASMEAVWMRKFIDGLGGFMPSNKRPMEMLCDNEPALAIIEDPTILKGARHFQRKYHYIRKVINIPRATVGATSLTRFYIPKVSQTPGISPTIAHFYKPIEDRCIHEGRVVDQFYYTSDHIDHCFSRIRLNCLYEINEPIVPRFILDFYSQVTLQSDDFGVILISFIIQNEFITLSLEQFGQILRIPFNGQAVFTSEWDLGSLAYSQETEGPYHTDLPTTKEINQFLQFQRVDPNHTIKSKNVILSPNQVLTKELRQDLKRWEELICENVFRLGGHRDHLPACLAHILYYILAEQQYNLAYFFIKRIESARASPKAHLPYGMFLTHLFRHVMEHYPHLDNGIYNAVDRVMRPLALKQTRKPQSDHGKARHSVSSISAHHNRGSSSRQRDDDEDDGASHASTPSPTTYLNSLKPLDYQRYDIPTSSEQDDDLLFERQTELLNQTQEIHKEVRGGFKSFGKALRGVFGKKKNAPNSPSKRPSTKGTSLSSIDYTPNSPTSSISPSTNGYLNSPISPHPRVPPPPPAQENASMDITLTLLQITPLDV